VADAVANESGKKVLSQSEEAESEEPADK
jgi:hypothetical protein